MRLPMFLAVAALALTAPAQLYDEPTFAQVERLIGAVQEAAGDPAAYTAAVARVAGSLYGKPTFAQVERLIEEVRSGGVSGTGSVSPEDVAVITGVHIGESTVKTQYVRGVWADTGIEVASDKTVEIGVNAHATETAGSNQSIAIGRDSLANSTATVAVGPNAFADGDRAVAMGWRANAIGARSVSIGTAAKSNNNYWTNGVKNVNADLQLAEGAYSVAIGFNDKAIGTSSIAIGNEARAMADGSVQLGTGENSEAHTLKFEDVTVVKNGLVVGSAPDPKIYDSDPVGGDMAISPGSMITVLPSAFLNGGSELSFECSGMRNYTVYLPNEPEVRDGLPILFEFNLPADMGHVLTGLASPCVTRLPCRIVSEQPYARLAVLNVTEMDDGHDWTPVITNCNLAYYGSTGRFDVTNSLAAVEGVSLHCATEFTLSYPLGASSGATTNTVDLAVVPAGASFIPGTLYRSARIGSYILDSGTELPFLDDTYVPVVLVYKTVHGTAEFRTRLEFIAE